jgi:hypothetical protein
VAAIRPPLLPTRFRAVWQGARAPTRVCANVKRSHFMLSNGLPFNWQSSPLQLPLRLQLV